VLKFVTQVGSSTEVGFFHNKQLKQNQAQHSQASNGIHDLQSESSKTKQSLGKFQFDFGHTGWVHLP
jgi:hypothetical protein